MHMKATHYHMNRKELILLEDQRLRIKSMHYLEFGRKRRDCLNKPSHVYTGHVWGSHNYDQGAATAGKQQEMKSQQ